LKEELTAEGVSITTEQTFKSTDQDFRTQLNAVKQSNLDAIVVSALSQPAILIMKQARELGITQPFSRSLAATASTRRWCCATLGRPLKG
jgi:branched-chain amino acid transport system substrate-binding protein